ncbi:unnamed protein product, partial [Sphagnum compactum]
MAAGEGDSDWGGDAAADTTTTEELLPAGRSSNLDHSGQQHVRLQEEELQHFLLNKEEAAAGAETHVSLKESEAAAGAPGASPSTAMEILENINSIYDEIPSTSPGVR